jgi:hypothetical protein
MGINIKSLLKKVSAVFLSLGILITVAACGNDGTTGNPSANWNINSLNQPSQIAAGQAPSVSEQQKWISNMLKIAAGVKNGQDGLDANQLTDSDFQALGITLSNYYVPFGTDMKGDISDKGTGAGKTQKLLIDKLTSNQGFKMDKDIATSIVNTVLGNIQHKSAGMHFAYCRVNTDTKMYSVNPSLISNARTDPQWSGLKMNTCVKDDKDQTPVTYWTLMSAATGEMRTEALKGAHDHQQNGKPTDQIKNNIGYSALAGNNVIEEGESVSEDKNGQPKTPEGNMPPPANIAGYKEENTKSKVSDAVYDGSGSVNTVANNINKPLLPDPHLTRKTGTGVANTIVAYTNGVEGPAPMFTASADASIVSPSVLALMEILKRSNPADGWGNARTTLSKKDDVANGDLHQTLVNIGESGKYNLLYATAPMKVSPFGDLVVDGQWTEPIVIPAASNPLIYSSIDSQGKVINDVNGGVFYGLGTYNMSANILRLANEANSGCSSNKKLLSSSPACKAVNVKSNNSQSLMTGNENGMAIDPGNIGSLIANNKSSTAKGMASGSWIVNTLAAGTSDTDVDHGWLTSGEQGPVLASILADYAKQHPNGVLGYYNYYNDGTDYKNGKGAFVHANQVISSVSPWFRYINNIGAFKDYRDYHNGGETGTVFGLNNQNPIIMNDHMLFIDGMNLLQYNQGGDNSGTTSDQDLQNANNNQDPKKAIDLYNVLQADSGTGKLMCSVSAVYYGGASCTGASLDGVNSSSVAKSDFDPTATVAPTPSGFSSSLAAPSDKVISSLFLTYTVASSPSNSNKSARLPMTSPEIQGLGWVLALGNLPKFDSTASFTSNSKPSASEEQQNILDWTWYLLNPSKMSYKMQVLSTALTSVLIGWHNDMLGTNGVGNLSGSTKYSGFVGYTQLPTLNTMSFTAQLSQMYTKFLPFFILFVFLIGCAFVVVNASTVSAALISFLVFAIMAFFPVSAINAITGGVNTVSDAMFSKKMMYWGITQQQATMQGAEAAAMNRGGDASKIGDVSSYLHSLYGASAFNTAASVSTTKSSAFQYNSQGDNGITVKWQAAKKLSSVSVSDTDGAGNKDMDSAMSSLVNGAANASFGGQSDVEGDNDYLYRGYTDIGNYSKYIYGDMNGNGSPTQVPTIASPDTSWWDSGVRKSYSNITKDYTSAIQQGYMNPTKSPTTIPNHYVWPFGSVIYKNGVTRYPDMSKLQPTQVVGISSKCLTGMSMASLNAYKGDNLGEKGCAVADKYGNATYDGAGASNSDYGSLAAYSLMSESPFFWESWNLYDQGLSTTLDTSGSYKDLILNNSGGKPGNGYFYNDRNGEMKDFLDMKGLFTYYMPYARMGNEAANKYFNTYGSKIYEGISTEEGKEGDYANNPTQLSQYYHNMNVLHAYEMYTPWVGIMDSAQYTKPVTVSMAGHKYEISNPSDPSTYPEGRPMVFSKSEQFDYKIKDSQLTTVEKKIQEIQKSTSDDYINLLNYWNYNDGVLNTAAAMSFTFNFNRVFSENGIMGLGKGAVLYPQGFDVSNFSYDSYLRLMIMNTNKYASAEYAQKNKDATEAGYYANIIENSSPSLAVLLIISDVMSIYVIPSIKLLLILGIVALFLIEIILNIFNQDAKRLLRRIWKTIVKPLLEVGLTAVAMNFFIMLLMSNGLTSVTGKPDYTINLGDPVITVFVITLIDILFSVVYGYLLFGVSKNIWNEGKTLSVGVVSLASTLAHAVGAGITSAFQGNGFMEGFNSKTNGTSGSRGTVKGFTGDSSGTTKNSHSDILVQKADVQMRNANRRREKLNSKVRERAQKRSQKRIDPNGERGDSPYTNTQGK